MRRPSRSTPFPTRRSSDLPIQCRPSIIPIKSCHFKRSAIDFHHFFDRCSNMNGSAYMPRSEEHTSELQSRGHLVCRLLLEKKKRNNNITNNHINSTTKLNL